MYKAASLADALSKTYFRQDVSLTVYAFDTGRTGSICWSRSSCSTGKSTSSLWIATLAEASEIRQ